MLTVCINTHGTSAEPEHISPIFFDETGGDESPTDYIFIKIKTVGNIQKGSRNKKKETKKIRKITIRLLAILP